MYRPNGRIHVIVLAAAAGLLGGCGLLPPSRAQFQERIAANNRAIARAMAAFRTTLMPLAEGKNPDPGTVRTAYQDVSKAVDDAKSATAEMLLPPSSSSAQAFLDAYKTYLDAEKGVVDDQMQKIVNKIEEKAGDDGRLFVNDRLKEISDKETANFKPLNDAQTAYDSEHNFQGVSFSQYLADLKNKK